MRAVRIHEPGSADVLRVDTIDVPEPREGEVRLQVEVMGVNFVDTYYRSGAYDADLPLTLGVEAAGVVDAVGPGVDDVHVGARVAHALQLGAYAEYQIVPANRLVSIPADVDTDVAAALLLQGMTAHYLAEDVFPLRPSHTALVHAAAGGVGQLLTQLCRRRGARIIATCSTEAKAELARAAGADEVVVYTELDVVAAVAGLTDGHGVDVVYDGVGQATFRDGLQCLRTRGMMVLYGQASGPVDRIDLQELRRAGSLFVTRPSLEHYIDDRDELERRSSDLFGWIADGTLDVRIDEIFPLEAAADAHRYLEGRRTHGKVLLRP